MVKVTVTQNGEKEVPVEVIADSVVEISQGIKRLRAGKLNDKALFLLIQHAAPCSPKPTLNEIKWILQGIESLEKEYIRK